MNGYAKMRVASTTKSRSMDFSDLISFPQKPKPIINTIPNPNSISQESKQIKTPDDSLSDQEDHHEEANGKKFSEVLRRNSSGTNYAVKKAFSIRRSSSVSERYCRIHDQSVTLASSSSPPPFMDDVDYEVNIEDKMQTRSMNKKHRTSKILKALLPTKLIFLTILLLQITISGIIIIILAIYKIYQSLRFKLPPGPRPWPIVGNLYDIKPVRFRCFAEWAQSYGPIISVWFGSTLNVIVSNTELAKEVLKENDQQLADRHRSRSTARFSRDGQDLIWADYGPHYVKVRKVCTIELFSPKRLEVLRPIREDEVTAMVESIFNDYCTNPDNYGKSLLVKKYLGAVAFNNITRLAFGKRFVNSEGVMDEQGLEFKAIGENGLKLGATLAMAEHIPWLRWMFPLEEEAFAKHGARRDRLTRAIMEEHTLARKNTGGTQQHFVDALHTLKDKYDLSEDTIIGLLWDMITAGMDTVAISVEWGMAELIKNPRVQQKAQEELDRVIGSSDRVMTEADISRLPYLQCVAKESLRMHPPTPLMLPHRANANVKIGGYDIPKGSNVHVNVWAVARDPAVWRNPSEFRPERFMEEDVDMKGHDYRLLPFGASRRVCPGAQLGINLVTSMLGHLLHHFTCSPPQGVKPEEIDMTENPGLVTYMRTPLQAVPTPRLPSHLYKRMAVDM